MLDRIRDEQKFDSLEALTKQAITKSAGGAAAAHLAAWEAGVALGTEWREFYGETEQIDVIRDVHF